MPIGMNGVPCPNYTMKLNKTSASKESAWRPVLVTIGSFVKLARKIHLAIQSVSQDCGRAICAGSHFINTI
jgi:hypothetical protein